MAVRKKRSKQFLENPLCIFTMLNTLVFHHYLSRVTAAAFELHNSDKEGIPLKPSKLQEAKQRKRLLFKGAQVLEEPQDSAEEHASLLKMYGRAHEVVKLLWTVLSSLDAIERTAFCVPMAYWPENMSKADMFQRLSLDILKGIAALKFRILEKSVMPPYSLLEIARPGASPELLSAKTREFLSTPQCCLDACWAKPVQQKVLSEADQPRTLHMHAARFSTSCRGVSSREEALHAQQRKHARGWEGAPILFVRQAAESVLQTAWDNFSVRTGIQEKGAPEKVKAASKIVRKRVIKHARPRQLGSPYFFFRNAAKKSSTETNEQIHRRWHTLSPEELQHWKMRHRLHSGRNKWMKAELAKKKKLKKKPENRSAPHGAWGMIASHSKNLIFATSCSHTSGNIQDWESCTPWRNQPLKCLQSFRRQSNTIPWTLLMLLPGHFCIHQKWQLTVTPGPKWRNCHGPGRLVQNFILGCAKRWMLRFCPRSMASGNHCPNMTASSCWYVVGQLGSELQCLLSWW